MKTPRRQSCARDPRPARGVQPAREQESAGLLHAPVCERQAARLRWTSPQTPSLGPRGHCKQLLRWRSSPPGLTLLDALSLGREAPSLTRRAPPRSGPELTSAPVSSGRVPVWLWPALGSVHSGAAITCPPQSASLSFSSFLLSPPWLARPASCRSRPVVEERLHYRWRRGPVPHSGVPLEPGAMPRPGLAQGDAEQVSGLSVPARLLPTDMPL